MKNPNYFAMAFSVFAFSLLITSCLEEDFDVAATQYAAEEIQVVNSDDPGTVILGTSNLYGKPVKEWTKDWWKYVISFNRAQCPLNPFQSLVGTSGQIGPVHCLVGSKNGVATRNIETTPTKALLVPVINTIKTYPNADTSFKPAPGQTVEQFLKISADKLMDQATNLSVKLDGKAIAITDANRFATNVFSITGNKDLGNYLELGITGKQQSAVSDGYFVTIDKLPVGDHELIVHAEIPQKGIKTDVTYTISVRK